MVGRSKNVDLRVFNDPFGRFANVQEIALRVPYTQILPNKELSQEKQQGFYRFLILRDL